MKVRGDKIKRLVFLFLIISCLSLSGCEDLDEFNPFPESMRDWTLNDTEEITDDIGDWFGDLFFYVDLWLDF